ncbi:MAG: hypothetical protein J6D26_06185 [Clostridia bacterium]|nr:hypothetical protein [Clostridia bacterium]
MKKILALIISLIMILPSAFPAAGAETDMDASDLSMLDKLCALGVIGEEYTDDGFEADDVVTRAEGIKIIVEYLGFDVTGDDNSSFADSHIKHDYESYVAIGQDLGLIEGNGTGNFAYEDELLCRDAVKMLVTALGYKPSAIQRGGYPSGYLTVAYQSDLLYGMDADVNAGITYIELFRMLDNALEVELMTETYGSEVIHKVSKEQTVLTDYHHIDTMIGDVRIDDKDGRRIMVTEDGSSKSYKLCDKIKISDVIDEEATVYYNTITNEIVYIEYDNSIELFYDYITDINGNTDSDNKYFAGSVKTVYFKNADEEFKTDNLKLYYGDEQMGGANKLVNCFARVVMKNDKVSRMYVYPLNEGGIIFHSDPSMIKYASGEKSDIVLAGLNDKEITVIIDGDTAEDLYALETDMVFDYWCDERKDEYILVASSRRISGTLTAYSETDGLVYIDEMPYEFGDVYPLYLSKDVNLYRNTYDISEFSGKPVEIAVDDNMQVRYMRISPDYIDERTFNGIVVAASEGTSGLDKERKLKIFHMDATTGEQIYTVDDKLKNSPVSFEYAASHAADYSGHGAFRFTANAENVIKKIDYIPYYGHSHPKSSEFTETAYTYIDGIMYSDVETYALVNIDGEFTVKVLNFVSDLIKTKPMTGSVTLVSDYDIKYNPIPDILVVTGDVDQLFTTTDNYALITSVRMLEDEKVKYVLAGGGSLMVSEDFHKASKIVAPSFICYRTRGLGKDKYQLSSVYNLNGGTDTWKTDEFAHDKTSGFFKADGLAFHNMNAAQFIVGGTETDVYPFYSNAITVYEVTDDGGKVNFSNPPTKISPLGETNETTEAWFYVANWPGMRTVRVIIYKK